MNLRTAVVVVLWVIFLATLARAALKGRLSYSAGRRIWMMFFLCILAFTFWGEAAEASLDQHFHDWPVALYLKYVCLIWSCHLYLQMLRDVGTRFQNRTLLTYLAPTAIGLGLLSFGLYVLTWPIPLEELRLIIIGARDAVLLVFIVFGFLSGTLSMWQQEQVLAMRVKQAAIVLYLACFALTAFGPIAAAVMTILHVGDAAAVAQFLQPLVYPGVLLFIFTLIPYRWYAGLLRVQRLLTYYRLKRVERLVVRLAGTWPDRHAAANLMTRADELELAIYRTIISILDCYPMLQNRKEEQRVFATIHHCVQQNRDYPALVEALASVRQ